MSLSSSFPEALRERYEPRRVLGQGGMGTVFLAREEELRRDVAIKVLKGDHDPQGVERLKREGRILAEIRHPHVVKLFDFGVLEEGPYLVMECVDGVPLVDAELAGDPLDVMLPIADALEELHRQDVLHRDVKPQNIMVAADGRPVLLDFGIVKPKEHTAMTATGMVLGTPAFLAPEALRGQPLGPGVDWYAWGVTLFVLEEERLPYQPMEILDWLQGDAKPELRFERLARDDPKARLLEACLAEDPGARPHGRAAIRAVLAGQPLPDVEPVPTPRGIDASQVPDPDATPRLARPAPATRARSPLPPLAAALALVAAAVLLLSPGRAPPAPPPLPTTTTPPAPPPAPRLLAPLGENPRGFREFENTRAGLRMIRIPAGSFTSHASTDVEVRGPPRPVHLDAFLLGKHEVTVAAYARFLAATDHPPPQRWEDQRSRPDLPACFLTHADARAFARWAGGRLPTPHEWARASGGVDGLDLPWGVVDDDTPRGNYGNYSLQAVALPFEHLRPVGSYPGGASPCGALDMIGNVAEWAGAGELPEAPGTAYLLGGSYLRYERGLRTWFLSTWSVTQVGGGTGFRLAMDDPEEES